MPVSFAKRTLGKVTAETRELSAKFNSASNSARFIFISQTDQQLSPLTVDYIIPGDSGLKSTGNDMGL